MMWRFVIFLVILRFSRANHSNEYFDAAYEDFDELNTDFDEVNSRTGFVNKLQPFFEKADDNGISAKCNNQWNAYIDGLKNRPKLWALKMFDSSAKIPSGKYEGNFVDLGFFDECLSVKGVSLSRLPSLPAQLIYGKYCIGTLPFKILRNILYQSHNIFDEDLVQPRGGVSTPNRKPGLQFGICVPEACSAAELETIFLNLGNYNLNMAFDDTMCQTKADQPELDSGAIVTLCVIGVLVLLTVACTIYDAILEHSEKKPAHKILIAFSLITNGKKILATSNSPSQISCLHGIRVLSMLWIMFGHRVSYQLNFPIRNFFTSIKMFGDRISMVIISAPLAVDTFFLMSGLVLAYVFLTSMAKGVKFNIIMFYVHRYIRLTPVVAIIALVNATLIKYYNSGPIYPSTVYPQLVDGCVQNWWRALLYIQNYGEHAECVTSSWYISTDMQLFILSPIILLPLQRWPTFGLLITGILTLCNMLASFLLGWFMELRSNLSANTQTRSDYMKYYYSAIYTRASPWLIGIVLGYYIFQAKQGKVRVKLNKVSVVLLWAASLAVTITCVLTGQDLNSPLEYDKLANCMHMAFVRPAWAIAVGWIIFACANGYGGPVNLFLSNPLFQVVSKFTYTLYLLHLEVIILTAAQMRSPPMFNYPRMSYVFWGDFAVTFTLANIVTLGVESPMIAIEQAVFGRTKKKEVKPSQPEEVRNIEKSVAVA